MFTLIETMDKCGKGYVYNIEFMVESVKIDKGDHQNINPQARIREEEEVEEEEEDYMMTEGDIVEENSPEFIGGSIQNDGKKKKKSKKGGKKKKKRKHKKKKKTIKVVSEIPEPVIIPPPPPYKLLPPFSLGIRLLEEKEIFVEQVILPLEPPVELEKTPKPEPPKEPIEIPPTVFAKKKGKKKKRKKGKGKMKKRKKKKGDKKKKGKKGKKGRKGKKGKRKKTKKIEPLPEPIKPPTPPKLEDIYRLEELQWMLPDEQYFGKGVSLVTTQSANELIMLLQRGSLHINVYRWPGRGEREKIGFAKFCILPRYSEVIYEACMKKKRMPMEIKSEGTVVIRGVTNKEEIGSITATFTIICYGDYWMSEDILSDNGILGVLATCPGNWNQSEQKKHYDLKTQEEISNLFRYINKRENIMNWGQFPSLTFEDIMSAQC